MEIVINRKRLHAAIRISDDAYWFDHAKFEQYLRHEIAHLLVDPLVEELQRQRLYTGVMEEKLEQSVELISKSL